MRYIQKEISLIYQWKLTTNNNPPDKITLNDLDYFSGFNYQKLPVISINVNCIHIHMSDKF